VQGALRVGDEPVRPARGRGIRLRGGWLHRADRIRSATAARQNWPLAFRREHPKLGL